MKKFLFITIILITMAGYSLFYIINVDKIYVDVSFEYQENEILEVYYVNNGKLVIAQLAKLENDDDILEIFNYLTIDKNKAPLGFYSYVPNSCAIINYRVEENTLILNINKQIHYTPKGYEHYALAIITETYKKYGFLAVKILVEGDLLENLHDFSLIDDYTYLLK